MEEHAKQMALDAERKAKEAAQLEKEVNLKYATCLNNILTCSMLKLKGNRKKN